MTANTTPIFTLTPNVSSNTVLMANTVASTLYDGAGTIGTDVFKIFTAGADGSWIDTLIAQYVSNAATASVSCSIRLFWSTKTSGATTNADTFLIKSFAFPAYTPTTTNIVPVYELSLGFALQAGCTLLAKHTVAQTNSTSGFILTAFGGDY